MSGKKRNKFYFFVEEMVRDLRQDGLTNVSWVMVNDAAGDQEWSKLGEAERTPYAAMSRENKFIYDRALTPQRRARLVRVRALLEGKNASLQREEDERRERQCERERRMREKMATLPSGESLAEKIMYVIDVEYFVAYPFIPCEFSVAEFSVKGGILDVLHFFVDPADKFPVNRSFDEKSRSESVHGIPFITRFEDARFDYDPPKNDSAVRVTNRNLYRNLFRDHDRLAKLLMNFLTGNGSNPIPIVFTLEDRSLPSRDGAVSGVDMVKTCCDWLVDQSDVNAERKGEWKALDVLPLEELLFAFHRNSKHGGVTPCSQYWNRFLSDGKWDFLPKSRCVFHDKIEASCTLGNVQKWCYAVFDHLKKPEPALVPLFDFEMTERHTPKPQPTPFVVHTMASLEDYLQEEEANVADEGSPLKGITDAFAAELFSQLKLGNNFRPDDSWNSLSPSNQGMGRGTVLKRSS